MNDYNNVECLTPLKELTHSSDIKNLTRKHNVGLHGQIGHGRFLSQSINFAGENHQ